MNMIIGVLQPKQLSSNNVAITHISERGSQWLLIYLMEIVELKGLSVG
jgi:hypothetical protein